MSSEPKPEVVTSAAYHADTDDDENDFKTNNGDAAVDGGEWEGDAATVKNNNRSALLLRKRKLEAELKEIDRALGQVESRDQPSTKDVKTSSSLPAVMDYDVDTDQEDFAASAAAEEKDINQPITNMTHDADKDNSVDFKTTVNYDAGTQDERFAAGGNDFTAAAMNNSQSPPPQPPPQLSPPPQQQQQQQNQLLHDNSSAQRVNSAAARNNSNSGDNQNNNQGDGNVDDDDSEYLDYLLYDYWMIPYNFKLFFKIFLKGIDLGNSWVA